MNDRFWDYVIEWLDQLPEAAGELGTGSKPRSQRTFYGKGGPYLTRYTLGSWCGWSAHVNVFHRSDEDPEPHSHPWHCASIMLAGGYREQRVGSDWKLRVRHVLPGMINLLPHGVFHRADLLEGRAITFFVTGPKISSWSFLDLEARAAIPWREFIRAKGLRTA